MVALVPRVHKMFLGLELMQGLLPLMSLLSHITGKIQLINLAGELFQPAWVQDPIIHLPRDTTIATGMEKMILIIEGGRIILHGQIAEEELKLTIGMKTLAM